MLRLLAELDPVDLTARHADLDELFLDLYRDATPAELPMRADVARLDLRLPPPQR